MTPNAPTWGEVEKFLKVDGWRRRAPSERRGSQADHVFFEKTLEDDRVLQTHISHSRDKRPSPGRFSVILREQLEVSRDGFWEALRSGEAADGPAQVEEGRPVEHEAWVVAVLAGEMHMSADEIQALDADGGGTLCTSTGRGRGGDSGASSRRIALTSGRQARMK